MTPKIILIAIATMLVVTNAQAQTHKDNVPLSSQELAKRTVYRRAIEAAIWGQPMLTFDAIRQAYFRDAKAKYNDLIWWSEANWKNQTITPNTGVRYVLAFCNTQIDGPIVYELPAGGGGSSFFGTFGDASFFPVVDVGTFGVDAGKGGKFLVLPPGYKGEVPSGYIPVRPETYNVILFNRSLLPNLSEEVLRASEGLVKQIKIYPLSKAGSPPAQRLIDLSDVLFEELVRYDESLYVSLARMINEEPVHPRDLEMMGMLRSLGIEKGKEFKPDGAMNAQLRLAAQEAQAWLIEGLGRTSTKFWPGSTWSIPTTTISLDLATSRYDEFKWDDGRYFDVDARGIAFANYWSPPLKLGPASYYLAAYNDVGGQPLRGGNTYRLHVPANPPVALSWSVTIYDRVTSGLFRDSKRIVLGSLDKGLKTNPDGSVDLYIGPKAPAGQESNWLYTPAGKDWFTWFRFYGAKAPLWDKTWKMPDIEIVK